MQLLHDLQLVRARALLHVQQCEWPMRVPVRAALLCACVKRHTTPQHSTALHHPTPPTDHHPTPHTDHLPGLAQAGERRTACGPVHGVRRKVWPMTCS
jgi:hypothetical protein